jgi:hypothetical protein
VRYQSAKNKERLAAWRRSDRCRAHLALQRRKATELMTPEKKAAQRARGFQCCATVLKEPPVVQRRNDWQKQKRPDDPRCTKVWRLRDPAGCVHEFRNLARFVREHADLFPAAALVVRFTNHGGKRRSYVQAERCLANLRPGRRPAASWRGWTWVTLDERALHGGADLLSRSPALSVQPSALRASTP